MTDVAKLILDRMGDPDLVSEVAQDLWRAEGSPHPNPWNLDFKKWHSNERSALREQYENRVLDALFSMREPTKEAIARINAADPKEKPIKSTATWGRWLKDGCPGVDD